MGRAEAFAREHESALAEIVARVVPGGRLVSAVPLKPDAEEAELTGKAAGYGAPLRLEIEDERGQRRSLVFHTATANAFGHDRRADRAAEMLLGYDTFGGIPRHVRALDVGAIRTSGGLLSLSDAGEFYLLTEYAEGHVYADELRRVAHAGRLEAGDAARAETLARTLAALHRERRGDRAVYRRSVRDLVGSGEGVAGILDGYPDSVPGAPLARLVRIQEECSRQRFRLRAYEDRCRRIHGDFHPFNIVFGASDEPALLDASRGSEGDPADDATCLSINYVFFAAEHPAAFRDALSPLWHRFWDTYLRETSDETVLDVAPAFLAWRGLVVANPVWYPAVSEPARDRVLSFIEAVLRADRLDPKIVEEFFP